MDGQTYLNRVRDSFPAQLLREAGPDQLIAYEEEFRMEWLATKLKMTSFVRYVPAILPQEFEVYSKHCLREAIRGKRGLPRGLQNGVVSFSVIAADHISPEVAAFASTRPPKHYSAFEVPIAYDLSTQQAIYYQDTMVWGSLYVPFLKAYIDRHFAIGE
ncbi:hypothetical protein LJC63_05740 [Ruminococcaceae bacterium OttesenSCG-928-L11]|nr:hypothetical protein [Ruminococcaceae bacterium OttesenSCG-928-L11]